MTDVTTNGLADGTGTPTPPLKLLTQYLKDLSFENPGAPTTPHSATAGWVINAASTSGPAML